MLDKFTFGDSPAAIFLADVLNQTNDSKLTRKVSAYLDQENRLLNEMVNANLSPHTLGSFVNFMRNRIKTSTLKIDNVLVSNLMYNVITGRIKSVLRRTKEVSHLNRNLKRDTNGVKVMYLIDAVADPITTELLRRRSKQKLARKQKVCSLY